MFIVSPAKKNKITTIIIIKKNTFTSVYFHCSELIQCLEQCNIQTELFSGDIIAI